MHKYMHKNVQIPMNKNKKICTQKLNIKKMYFFINHNLKKERIFYLKSRAPFIFLG